MVKIRHIKCDEGKPNCDQCSKTGRTCDGYEETLVRARADKSQTSNASSHFPLNSCQVLAHRLAASNDETRSFEFFHREFGPAVFGAFDRLAVVKQLTMQLSCTDNTVKHAIVALGSIGEHLMKDRSLTMKTLYQDKSLRFAHAQNTKAIQQLRMQLSSGKEQSVELTLISCFLFIIFDFFFGDDISSHTHLKAGINILKGVLPLDGGGGVLATPSIRSAAISELADLFTIIDLHAAIWLGLSSFQLPPLIDNGNDILSRRPLICFQSLEEACDSLSHQMVRTHVFHQSLEKFTPLDYIDGIPFHIHARREEYLFDLRTWAPALDALLENIPMTVETTRRVVLMRMVYLSTFINLSTILQPPRIHKYHKHNSIFEQIVDLAKVLLRPASTENREDLLRIITVNNQETDSKNLPIFAFVAGAIQPLHMVAEKCCDTRLCLEAIELLEERPWREGAWDSTVMATIARRKLQERSEFVR